MIKEIIPEFFNNITIFANGITIILLIVVIGFSKSKLANFIKKNTYIFAFIIAIVATLGSLSFSEIVGYEPCKLCWFQRIFMYPLSLLLLGNLFKNSKNISFYGIIFSIIGGSISVYHYYIQRFNVPMTCSIDGGVSCSDTLSFGHGYISIPIMALSAFILISIFCGLNLKKLK